MSWEVVSTRNVGNVGIVVDNDETCNRHNETICQYLTDKEKYVVYLRKICNGLGVKEMSIVDKTMHNQSLKVCTKVLLACWKNKLMGRNDANDYSLYRLLTHDARRSLLMWSMIINANGQ